MSLTLNSVKFWPAGRTDKHTGERISEALVFIRDEAPKGTPPAKYLQPQVTGGERPLKRFELAMIRSGRLPSSGFLVPTRKAPKDKYGNLPVGMITRILSDLQAFGATGFNYGLSARSKQAHKGKMKNYGSADVTFFAGSPNGEKSLGVWMRNNQTQKVTPILVWKPRQEGYKKRFKMHETTERIVADQFEKAFKERIMHAIQTAR
jgi:hypothetical protein